MDDRFHASDASHSHLTRVTEQARRLERLLQEHPELDKQVKFELFAELVTESLDTARLYHECNLDFTAESVPLQLRRDSRDLGHDLLSISTLVEDALLPGLLQEDLEDLGIKTIDYRHKLGNYQDLLKTYRSAPLANKDKGSGDDSSRRETFQHERDHPDWLQQEEIRATQERYYNKYQREHYENHWHRDPASSEEDNGASHGDSGLSSGENIDVYFRDAEGLTITDGFFNSVSGTVWTQNHSGDYVPSRPPNGRRSTSFFPNLKNSTISGGDFMSIGGDYVGHVPHRSRSQQPGSHNGIHPNRRGDRDTRFSQNPHPSQGHSETGNGYRQRGPSRRDRPFPQRYSNEYGREHDEPIPPPYEASYRRPEQQDRRSQATHREDEDDFEFREAGPSESTTSNRPIPNLSPASSQSTEGTLAATANEEGTLTARFGELHLTYQHSSSRTSLNLPGSGAAANSTDSGTREPDKNDKGKSRYSS